MPQKASFKVGELMFMSNFMSNKLTGESINLYKSMGYKPSMNV
jgi:hypothetical protein